MECILCNKQYVEKAGTNVNIRLNNHRKNVKKVDAIMACKQFQQESHNFNKLQNLPLSIIEGTLPNLKKSPPATYRKRKFLDSKSRYAILERF